MAAGECEQMAKLKATAGEALRKGAKPFSLRNIDRCRYTGLYAIWYRHRCLYVGQSELQTVYDRLYSHLTRCHNEALRLWIQVKDGTLRFTSCPIEATDGTIRAVERCMIRHLRAETNKA